MMRNIKIVFEMYGQVCSWNAVRYRDIGNINGTHIDDEMSTPDALVLYKELPGFDKNRSFVEARSTKFCSFPENQRTGNIRRNDVNSRPGYALHLRLVLFLTLDRVMYAGTGNQQYECAEQCRPNHNPEDSIPE